MKVKSTGPSVYLAVLTAAGYKHFCISSEPVDVPECAEVTELLTHGRLTVIQDTVSDVVRDVTSERRRRKGPRRR